MASPDVAGGPIPRGTVSMSRFCTKMLVGSSTDWVKLLRSRDPRRLFRPILPVGALFGSE
jgi:hypothetical protein